MVSAIVSYAGDQCPRHTWFVILKGLYKNKLYLLTQPRGIGATLVLRVERVWFDSNIKQNRVACPQHAFEDKKLHRACVCTHTHIRNILTFSSKLILLWEILDASIPLNCNATMEFRLFHVEKRHYIREDSFAGMTRVLMKVRLTLNSKHPQNQSQSQSCAVVCFSSWIAHRQLLFNKLTNVFPGASAWIYLSRFSLERPSFMCLIVLHSFFILFILKGYKAAHRLPLYVIYGFICYIEHNTN